MKISICFMVRPSRALKNGLCSIECSISIGNKRLTQRLPRQIKPSDWNQSKQVAKGKSLEAVEINDFLEAYRHKIYSLQTQIIQLSLPYNIETFRTGLNGELDINKNKTLVALYEEFNKEYHSLKESNQIATSTYKKHSITLKHLRKYLKFKYNKEDILLIDVTRSFIEGFYFYLCGTLGIQNNSAVNYMKKLKRVINMALNDGIISKNPFANYTLHLENVDVNFLTIEEIKIIYNKHFESDRLEKVKDVFVFSCMTGLAYIDCKTFEYTKHIIKDEQGNEFINKKRNKTDVIATIPLLPIAKEILEKYNFKLPIPSNQKVNEYLKEIATLCNIEKQLHFHCARHSFATSVTLNNNVALTSVSKMMGHSNTKITQRYAKVLKSTLITDRDNIIEKISI